jgi:hypothetical protein
MGPSIKPAAMESTTTIEPATGKPAVELMGPGSTKLIIRYYGLNHNSDIAYLINIDL